MISGYWSVLTMTVEIEVVSSGMPLAEDWLLQSWCHLFILPVMWWDGQTIKGRVDLLDWHNYPVAPTYPDQASKTLNKTFKYIGNSVQVLISRRSTYFHLFFPCEHVVGIFQFLVHTNMNQNRTMSGGKLGCIKSEILIIFLFLNLCLPYYI